MELIFYLSFHRKGEKISYWRTSTRYEVDFIVGDTIATEVKISQDVHKQDLIGLLAFCEEHPNITAFIVSQDIKKCKMELVEGKSIIIMPWRDFLTDL